MTTRPAVTPLTVGRLARDLKDRAGQPVCALRFFSSSRWSPCG
jgi:hypothetical protein